MLASLTKEICIAIFQNALQALSKSTTFLQKIFSEERWVVSDWLIYQDGINMPNEVKATIS